MFNIWIHDFNIRIQKFNFRTRDLRPATPKPFILPIKHVDLAKNGWLGSRDRRWMEA